VRRQARFLAANASLEEADIVVIGVPLEKTVSWRGGTVQAPQAIRDASDSIESFSVIFMSDLAQLQVCDAGDVNCVAELEESLGRIEEKVELFLRQGRRVLLLGGEHTLTLPALKAAKAVFGPVQLLVFDAHSDLRDEYEGRRVCHATVTRRCLEVAERVVIVGARSFYGGEFELLPRFKCALSSFGDFVERLDPSIPLYVSLDLDILDASQCPGVTNPEPGGADYRDLIGAFKDLRGRFNVVTMDIVELAPPHDPSAISAVCAAKLAVEGMLALWG